MIALPLLSLALFAPTAAPSGTAAVDSAAIYADTLPDAWAPHEWVAADAVPPALVPAADGNSAVHLLTRTLTFTLGGTLGVHFPAGAPTAAFTLGGLELRNDRDSLVSVREWGAVRGAAATASGKGAVSVKRTAVGAEEGAVFAARA